MISLKQNHRLFLCIYLSTLLFFCSGCMSNATGKKTSTEHASQHIPTLYLLSGEGDLDAYRADGTHLWQMAHQGDDLTELPSVGTHLLMTPDGLCVATNTLAMYRADGHLLWHHTLSQQAETAILVGQTLYVTEQTGIVTAWDLHGNLLWQETTIPILHAFVTAADSHLLFVGGDATVVALDQQSGRVAWTRDIGTEAGQVEQLMVEHQSLVVQADTSLSVLDTTSGHTTWSQPLEVVSLFVDASSHTIYTVSNSATFTPAGSSPSAGSSLSAGLTAFFFQTGKIRWHQPFSVQPTSVGTISSQGVLWASSIQITAWDLHGNQRWQIPYQGEPMLSVSSVDAEHSFLLIAHDGTIQNLDAASGKIRWHQTAVEGASDAFPTLVQRSSIWITGAVIEAIRLNDGGVQWQITPNLPAAEVLITETNREI